MMSESSSDEARSRANAIIEEVAARLRQIDPVYGYWHLSVRQRTELRLWMIERYTEAIAADESFPDAYVRRGAELYFEGWIDEAKADMRKAFALQPTEPDRYLTMSYPFEGEERRNILKKGMELGAPEFIKYQTLRMMYIQTFWYQGDFAEYVRLLLEWIPQLDPNDFMYRNQLEALASGYSALGQHESAEAAYRTALVASADASERQSVSQMIVRTRMHRNQYNEALATLPEFADAIPADELSVLKAVLLVLASPGSEEAKGASMAALPAAELLGQKPGPLGGSTSYYSFLLGTVYAGAQRTEAARALLIRFANDSAANRREWGVTLSWEIAKARELASLRALEGDES